MSEIDKEIVDRKASLTKYLMEESQKHNKIAMLFELLSAFTFYFGLLFGGLAVVVGLVKSIAVPTELISIFAAVSTGLNFLYQQARFRSKADWNYSVRDTADQIKQKLDFEMPIPLKIDDIVALSKDWREKRSALGMVMHMLHKNEGSRSHTNPQS